MRSYFVSLSLAILSSSTWAYAPRYLNGICFNHHNYEQCDVTANAINKLSRGGVNFSAYCHNHYDKEAKMYSGCQELGVVVKVSLDKQALALDQRTFVGKCQGHVPHTNTFKNDCILGKGEIFQKINDCAISKAYQECSSTHKNCESGNLRVESSAYYYSGPHCIFTATLVVGPGNENDAKFTKTICGVPNIPLAHVSKHKQSSNIDILKIKQDFESEEATVKICNYGSGIAVVAIFTNGTVKALYTD